MGAAVQCCGEDRKIATMEKRRMLEGKDPNDSSFKFNMEDTQDGKKQKSKGVRFADPMDDSQPCEFVDK